MSKKKENFRAQRRKLAEKCVGPGPCSRITNWLALSTRDVCKMR